MEHLPSQAGGADRRQLRRTVSTVEAGGLLRKACGLRQKYRAAAAPSAQGLQADTPFEFTFGADGLMHVHTKSALGEAGVEVFKVPGLEEYNTDMATLFGIRTNGPVASFCSTRLRFLQTRFELQQLTAGHEEQRQVSSNSGHRDFYNVRKVDTHVHHSAAMNAKHLLRFMKKKLKHYSGDSVDGERTLRDVFMSMGLSWTDLNIDKLGVWADDGCMHRFDRFNQKYSPIGHNELRTIFLKTDNAMGGRYLAELTKELLEDLEEAKYQHVEWRLSIYGRKRDEWENLSRWVLGEGGKGLGGSRALLSPNLKWMIQIPRLFSLYKRSKQLDNFAEMLENIFTPMFEATLDPEAHPQVARFLREVSGFDTVDDESRSVNPSDSLSHEPLPREWDLAENPSYKYYSYFISANLWVLNHLRRSRGLNTFAYRPHAGEAGDVFHLDVAFLLADGINHGLNLRKAPVLQYLFYMEQIGVAMSPCSNNQLFLAYAKNPYPVYFARGLNVSLSTDDPLMFHQTKEPLMEEYSIAKQLWRFSAVDLCEMARNSVLQSGFDDEVKAKWLGTASFKVDNDPLHTNLPHIRMQYRSRLLREERSLVGLEAPQAGLAVQRADQEECRPTPAKRAKVEAAGAEVTPVKRAAAADKATECSIDSSIDSEAASLRKEVAALRAQLAQSAK